MGWEVYPRSPPGLEQAGGGRRGVAIDWYRCALYPRIYPLTTFDSFLPLDHRSCLCTSAKVFMLTLRAIWSTFRSLNTIDKAPLLANMFEKSKSPPPPILNHTSAGLYVN